jgi:hypothetical protein
MRKIKLFERVLSTGYNLAVIPLTYIVRIGYAGKVLCIVFLIVYSMPVLIVFNSIGFIFWLFNKNKNN